MKNMSPPPGAVCDRYGRMLYHPHYHPNHNKPYSVKEIAYICKKYKRGRIRILSLELGRTEHSIRNMVDKLRKYGKFEHYKNMKL